LAALIPAIQTAQPTSGYHASMQKNALQQALEAETLRRRSLDIAPVISLSDADFHANGYLPPGEALAAGFADWLEQRRYRPDARGSLPAREAIARLLGTPGPLDAGDLTLHPDQLLITASSSESYSLLFGCFASPGDNVLLPLPCYPLFTDLCAYAGLEARFYPLDPKRNWEPDLAVLDVLADERTCFVVVISPNNPTGSIVSNASLQGIAASCKRVGATIISDEVFSAFRYQGTALPRAAVVCPQLPVYTFNGLSKLAASPDLKLGWIAVTGPDSAERMAALELRSDTYLNANSISQALLPHLLADPALPPFVQGIVADCSTNRDSLETLLINADLPAIKRLNLPAGGIHCVLELSRAYCNNAETLAIRLLREHGLYLHPGELYGLYDQPCLIISLLKKPAQFEAAIATLAMALTGC